MFDLLCFLKTNSICDGLNFVQRVKRYVKLCKIIVKGGVLW